MSTLLFRIRKEEFGRGAEIRMGVRRDDGRIGIVQPMQVVMREDDTVRSEMEPSAIYVEDVTDFQGLMDQLWEVGVRPSDIGTPGHLAATQAHLSDMRKLVEKTLDVKL